MASVLLVLFGVLLVLAAVIDIVATVLHPEFESPLSSRYQQSLWWVLRRVNGRLPQRFRELRLLSWGVPLMVGGLVALWIALLIVGFALIYRPWIGDAVMFRSDNPIEPSFSNALYFSGVTMATLGYGDVQPVSPMFRTLAVLESLFGLVTVSFTVTYVLSIYPTLAHQREIATALDAEVAGQVSALPMLRRYLSDDGRWVDALAERLRELALELLALTESHEQHAVLYYAHPRRVQHSLLRILLITRSLVGTLRYTLSPERHREIVHHPHLILLEQALHYSLSRFSASLHIPTPEKAGDQNTHLSLERDFERQRSVLEHLGFSSADAHGERAVAVLVESLIEITSPDLPRPKPQTGNSVSGNGQNIDPATDLSSNSALDAYITFREQVDPHIAAYARISGYSLDEALTDAQTTWWVGDNRGM